MLASNVTFDPFTCTSSFTAFPVGRQKNGNWFHSIFDLIRLEKLQMLASQKGGIQNHRMDKRDIEDQSVSPPFHWTSWISGQSWGFLCLPGTSASPYWLLSYYSKKTPDGFKCKLQLLEKRSDYSVSFSEWQATGVEISPCKCTVIWTLDKIYLYHRRVIIIWGEFLDIRCLCFSSCWERLKASCKWDWFYAE